MAYDFRAVQRASIERTGDPELIAAWNEATRLDEVNPGGMHRAILFDLFQHGGWRAGRRPDFLDPPDREPASDRPAPAPRPTWIRTGDRVRSARALVRYSQSDLAEVIGISRSALSRIERGQRALRYGEACSIADATGIDVRTLRG